MELGIGMFGDLQINAKGEIQPLSKDFRKL